VVDQAMMKLGRRAARVGPGAPRAPALSGYTALAPMPPPPARFDWSVRVANWPMYANDRVGDCTTAAIGHMIQLWTAGIVTLSEEEVLAAYAAVSGYNPDDPNSDQGAAMLDVLMWWYHQGMPSPAPPVGRDRLDGYAALRAGDDVELRQAIVAFGGVYAGLAMPLSAQSQDVWSDVGDAPGSWGGHCVPLVGYNETGPICVTWGAVKQMEWDFWRVYGDEAYALLSRDFLDTAEAAPNGVPWAQLQADLATISTP